MKKTIREEFLKVGAMAAGFARSGDIDPEVIDAYRAWIGEGKHAGMDYLVRHAPLKVNPEAVMPSTATVISLAFSYVPLEFRNPELPMIACYAYGQDYHDVIRKRLTIAVENLKKVYGGEWRICIDTAPVSERYWALKSGIGVKGENGSVIVDGCGSLCFLAEVLTSLQIDPDEPGEASCMACGKCIKACPTGALQDDGTVDARKCLSYLTIEHRGEWSPEQLALLQKVEEGSPIGKGEEQWAEQESENGKESENGGGKEGRKALYGCDICQRVCPYNRGAPPTAITEFNPLDGIMTLTAKDCLNMNQEAFSRFFRNSPIKRAKLQGLTRNAGNLPDNRL